MGTVNEATDAYRIRPARPDDVAALPAIEDAAGDLFADAGWPDIAAMEARSVTELEGARADGRLFVAADAEDRPVGFALLLRLGDGAHLDELAVHPAHGRRGLGARLVTAACAWARGCGQDAITLATMRDVAFNAPYYTRLGFEVVPTASWTPALVGLIEHERELGLPVAHRVIMRKRL